jgi:hypothetical protein
MNYYNTLIGRAAGVKVERLSVPVRRWSPIGDGPTEAAGRCWPTPRGTSSAFSAALRSAEAATDAREPSVI